MTGVKPLGRYVYEYFEEGDKVEVLEGSDFEFYGVNLGDILEVRYHYGKCFLIICGVRYNGDQLVLRKVTARKKGLCDFLTRVEAKYSGRPKEKQYAHKE